METNQLKQPSLAPLKKWGPSAGGNDIAETPATQQSLGVSVSTTRPAHTPTKCGEDGMATADDTILYLINTSRLLQTGEPDPEGADVGLTRNTKRGEDIKDILLPGHPHAQALSQVQNSLPTKCYAYTKPTMTTNHNRSRDEHGAKIKIPGVMEPQRPLPLINISAGPRRERPRTWRSISLLQTQPGVSNNSLLLPPVVHRSMPCNGGREEGRGDMVPPGCAQDHRRWNTRG